LPPVNSSRASGALLAAILLAGPGCEKPDAPPPAKSAPPAVVDSPRKESELTTITLTQQAVERLGVRVAAIERVPVERRGSFGAVLEVPPGRSAPVLAPHDGRLARPPVGSLPLPGKAVKTGEALAILYAIVPPAERIRLEEAVKSSEGLLATARARADGSRKVLERAREVFQRDASSARALDDAQAAELVALAEVKAAEVNHDTLGRQLSRVEAGTSAASTLTSPLDGIVRSARVVEGQTVASGSVAFEVESTAALWVRVPLPSAEASGVDATAPAFVRPLGAAASSPSFEARPALAPPSADAASLTVDLVYEVQSQGSALRPGERVQCLLKLQGSTEALQVPWAAVVFDSYGGAWVYESRSPVVFVRRRVELSHTSPDGAAYLTRGPEPGTQVVVEGAAELNGTELGYGK